MSTSNTVLVVDDDKNICELVRLYLVKEGFETKCAYDGVTAVKMVAGMSLEEKIGQMLLIGIDGTEIDEGALSMLRDYHVGGVILFDRNMNNKYQVTGLNANLQRLNKEYNKLPENNGKYTISAVKYSDSSKVLELNNYTINYEK